MKTITMTDEQAVLIKAILEQAQYSTHCLSLTEQLGLLPDDESTEWLEQDKLYDWMLADVLQQF